MKSDLSRQIAIRMVPELHPVLDATAPPFLAKPGCASVLESLLSKRYTRVVKMWYIMKYTGHMYHFRYPQ